MNERACVLSGCELSLTAEFQGRGARWMPEELHNYGCPASLANGVRHGTRMATDRSGLWGAPLVHPGGEEEEHEHDRSRSARKSIQPHRAGGDRENPCREGDH